MDRDEVVEIADRVTVPGLAYLMLLFMLGHATIPELVLITHGDRCTVGNYLRALEMRGFVIRLKSGHADRWFPSDKAAAFMRSPTAGNLSSCVPTTTTALLDDSLKSKAVAEASATAGKTSSCNPDPGAGLDDDLLLAFRAAGIGSNAWQGLADLEWLDADYVRAHDKYRRSRKETVGLMLTRMRAGDLPPEVEDEEEDVGAQWEKFLKQRR